MINTFMIFTFYPGVSTVTIPMNEEMFRLLSIFIGSPMLWMFTTVLSLVEFFCYIIEFGHKLSFIFIRALCVISHFVFLSAQLSGWHLYKKSGRRRYIVLGYITAVFLHVLWNTQIAPNLI